MALFRNSFPPKSTNSMKCSPFILAISSAMNTILQNTSGALISQEKMAELFPAINSWQNELGSHLSSVPSFPAPECTCTSYSTCVYTTITKNTYAFFHISFLSLQSFPRLKRVVPYLYKSAHSTSAVQQQLRP